MLDVRKSLCESGIHLEWDKTSINTTRNFWESSENSTYLKFISAWGILWNMSEERKTGYRMAVKKFYLLCKKKFKSPVTSPTKLPGSIWKHLAAATWQLIRVWLVSRWLTNYLGLGGFPSLIYNHLEPLSIALVVVCMYGSLLPLIYKAEVIWLDQDLFESRCCHCCVLEQDPFCLMI